jgi:hypothetical protein
MDQLVSGATSEECLNELPARAPGDGKGDGSEMEQKAMGNEADSQPLHDVTAPANAEGCLAPRPRGRPRKNPSPAQVRKRGNSFVPGQADLDDDKL